MFIVKSTFSLTGKAPIIVHVIQYNKQVRQLYDIHPRKRLLLSYLASKSVLGFSTMKSSLAFRCVNDVLFIVCLPRSLPSEDACLNGLDFLISNNTLIFSGALCLAESYVHPSAVATKPVSSYSLKDLIGDGFLWAVPRNRRTIEKRWKRKFGSPEYVNKLMLPKTNLRVCNSCGHDYEVGILCRKSIKYY